MTNFEHLSISDWLIDDARLDRLAREVLRRIPGESAEEFPLFSVYEQPSREGAYVDADAIYLDARKFSEWRDDVAIGVLAHEFTHCLLEHGQLATVSLEEEAEADELASRWGFANEVRAMRVELGEPTMDARL